MHIVQVFFLSHLEVKATQRHLSSLPKVTTMGVPALFRWLSKKYPKIISPVIEDEGDSDYGREPQYLDPNPNGELDNLYLDMNGIVHPCSHPEHKPPPETEDEMFLDVFTYTDRVLMMARPRKVLVIAVDGVAPRAKMNQQRARRFRAAQDAKIHDAEHQRQVLEAEARGEVIDDAVKGKKKWDSNAITPGTPFMDGLAAALRYWVAYKLATDPGWKDLQVIISDATVPGEGEHKLMSFIRSQRLDPSHDPNTKHCIYGLDADLIFLGLATHEPHFRVLREDVFAQGNGRNLRISDQINMTPEEKAALNAKDAKKPFLWLHVNILREYLEVELNVKSQLQWDFERAIDDWVFMCFFVGNDFLPHLPSLSVRDNGIDILVGCWKRVLPKVSDYITCDGKLNIDAVEHLLAALAPKEDDIFRRRRENELRYQNNEKRKKKFQEEDRALRAQYLPTVSKGKEKAPMTADANMPLMDTSGNLVDGYAQLSNKDIVNNRDVITKANMANASAAEQLRKLIALKGTEVTQAADASDTSQGKKRSASEVEKEDKEIVDEEEDDTYGDNVRDWEAGYHERYYKTKFNLETDEEIEKVRKDVVRSYLEGISWVLLYYYQGCPSWQWYYPYHYAPFASDFTNLRDIVGEEGIKFVKGQPFSPYEQLMSVLPAASGHNLPEVFRKLMSSPDSEIIDFYPEEFKIDMNGAKMSWQGIALLPFIDEHRLLEAVRGKYHLLTDAEKERNTNKAAQLYISSENKRYGEFLREFDEDREVTFASTKTGLAGVVKPISSFTTKGELLFPLKEGDMPHISNKAFLAAWYDFPYTYPGKSMLLNGYIPHDKVLTNMDKNAITDSYQGRQRNGPRFNFQNNSNYVNVGPRGNKDYFVYAQRFGGYRSLACALEDKQNNNNGPRDHQDNSRQGPNQRFNNRQRYNQQSGLGFKAGGPSGYGGAPQQNYGQNYSQNYGQNYGQNFNGYNQGFNQNYNQSYNQGYNQNYNQGFNQGYNRGHLGGYNQGYGQQGFNGYNQGHKQGFNQNRGNSGGYRGGRGPRR